MRACHFQGSVVDPALSGKILSQSEEDLLWIEILVFTFNQKEIIRAGRGSPFIFYSIFSHFDINIFIEIPKSAISYKQKEVYVSVRACNHLGGIHGTGHVQI